MLSMMILIIMILSILMLMLNFSISKKNFFSREKMSSYECGFTPMSSPRLPFSINFYLIGILFLIFDIEVIFLFPFIKLFKNLMLYEFNMIMLFILMILYLGLEFEKKEGSLKWML